MVLYVTDHAVLRFKERYDIQSTQEIENVSSQLYLDSVLLEQKSYKNKTTQKRALRYNGKSIIGLFSVESHKVTLITVLNYYTPKMY